MCEGERNCFPWIASLYPWSVPYNANFLAKRHQVQFLGRWCNSTCDWTPISRAIGKYSTHFVNWPVYKERERGGGKTWGERE